MIIYRNAASGIFKRKKSKNKIKRKLIVGEVGVAIVVRGAGGQRWAEAQAGGGGCRCTGGHRGGRGQRQRRASWWSSQVVQLVRL
jgi:hypothetical protein